MYDRVMHGNLAIVTAPTTEPLLVAEAKDHLRVIVSDEDDYIEGLIQSARTYLDGRDGVLGRALITQTWDYTLDEFPARQWIPLPLPPIQSIVSIKYRDAAGTLQTFGASNYSLSADKQWRPRVILAAGASWPGTWGEPEAVVIQTTNGYGNAVDVPIPLRQALLLILGHLYENREPVNIGNIVTPLPLSVDALLAPYMVTAF